MDTMKIAISTDGDFVSSHFGRCPSFTIAEIEDGKILKKETIANPGHSPDFLPEFLAKQGISCIIAGGAGQRVQQLFAEKGIDVLVGISGKIDEVLEKFAKDELTRGENPCKPGLGKGYGIKKEGGKE